MSTVGDVGSAISTALDRRAVVWGLVGIAVTLAIAFLGSDGLVWFDAALVGYLFGVVFMVFGVIYRYAVWLRRPPTAMLNRRGWDAFRVHPFRNLAALVTFPLTLVVRRLPLRYHPSLVFRWGCTARRPSGCAPRSTSMRWRGCRDSPSPRRCWRGW